jgi:hypothetical protein
VEQDFTREALGLLKTLQASCRGWEALLRCAVLCCAVLCFAVDLTLSPCRCSQALERASGKKHTLTQLLDAFKNRWVGGSGGVPRTTSRPSRTC